MQYIDDDMDELFRKAAEGYPLNTNSADWNEVERKLSVTDTEQTKEVDKKKNNNKLLLLLLLLPVTWLGYEYYSHDQIHKNLHPDKNILSPSTQGTTVISQKINLQPTTTTQQSTANHLSTAFQGNKNRVHGNKKTQIRSVVLAPQTNTTLTDQSIPFVSDPAKQDVTADNNQNKLSTQNNDENNIILQQVNDKKENIITTPSVKIKKEKLKNEHGMYAGVIVSPDISTVKFQSIKTTGFSIGIIIGYRFNKKISLETGIEWNKKYYYSDGKYFNTKKIVLPANAKIINLNGVCKMIEVPLTIKYDFKSSGKTVLSIYGGVSSYIMKSENYAYTIEHTGVQYPRNATYKNSSSNLLAVATIGLGYNHTLAKGTVLRLEPFIKIPVKGVGIGQLPIISSGMNIGITKKLF